MAEIKTVLTDIEAQAKRGIACTTFNGSKTHFRAIIELIEAAVLSANAGKVDAVPLGYISSSSLERALRVGGSINLWLQKFDDTDVAVYASPTQQAIDAGKV